MRRLLTLLSLGGILAGCETVPCTGQASSVTVSVFDASGAPAAPDDVTYTVDGGPVRGCEDLGDGTEFICGWNETGDFRITVQAGGTSYVEELSVGLAADGCSPQSEYLEFTI